MSEGLKPGDLLQVRQWFGLFPYYHHGIYIRDDQVIQFGLGLPAVRGSRRLGFATSSVAALLRL
jgi:Lecithin retinol acyltransferase